MAVPEKTVIFGVDARIKILAGALLVSNVVKRTLGPFGANAILEKGGRITNDGVSIAREIRSEDEIEQLGVAKMIEVATRTNDLAGDGTTTAITIGGALIESVSKLLTNKAVVLAGVLKPSEVIQKVEAERISATEKLVAMSTKITTEDQLIAVAKVSVEDDVLGTLIGKAQWELGPDGYLIAEETTEPASSSERINGIRIDNGFSTSAVMNKPDKKALEVEEVKIIYTSHTVQSLNQIVETLQALVTAGQKKVIVMARAFTPQAIQECITNIEKGIEIFPLNAPYTDQTEVMRDLEAILGGHFLPSEERSLDSLQISDVGMAKMVVAKQWDTVFTGYDDQITQDRITARVAVLEEKLTASGSDFEKKLLQQRIAQLKNGFGLIKVGAATDTERGYKKDKVDDAVNAVRAAFQEGVIPGAGQAFKTIADSLPDDSILKTALAAPYLQIMASAPSDFVIPDWVQDPVKVARIALEKACSVASSLATAEIGIATKKEKPRLMHEVDNPVENGQGMG